MGVGRQLEVGDRVRVSGGYDMDPPWLAGEQGYSGEVAAFMPSEGELPSALICLDDVIVLPNATGQWAVLSLGHVGSTWAEVRPRVHVELCDLKPSLVAPRFRVPGVWIESHATYEVVVIYGPAVAGTELEDVESRLQEVHVDLDGWRVTYRDPRDGSTWIRDYPQSELHGGGAPRLRRLTSDTT